VQREQGEERPRLAGAEGHLPPADAGLHGSQDTDAQPPATVLRRAGGDQPRRLSAYTADPTVDLPAGASVRGAPTHTPPEEIHMSSHRPHRRQIRRVALALGCCALIAPSSALAQKIGDTPADFAKPVTPAPKIGDTPADFAAPVVLAPARGDTPVDFPGASRAPQYQPPATIQVVRPERTVVRDVDEVLPLVLSGAALLLALFGLGVVMTRTRTGTARRLVSRAP
jgi:hypothetical protein